MREPWKSILCDSEQCISEMFKEKESDSLNTKLDPETIESYKIYPDIDNDLLSQFTCPRCGKVETWGVTRRNVAKILYEKFK